jgi:septal ring factor EnvC (AmiA/AmiB activator)
MHTKLHVNPVRRVLNMLQMMQKKVSEEGEVEQSLFDQYMCYCKSSEATLSVSIAEARTKIPQLESSLSEGTAEKAQLTSDIAQAEKDKDSAEKSIAEAKAMREKEQEAFTKEDTTNKANAGSMAKALTALRKGQSSAFLQTSSAATLRHCAMSLDLPEWDRQNLFAFLSTDEDNQDSEEERYEPQSGDVIGIISQLKETTEKEIAEAQEAEKKALDEHNALVGAKTREVTALSKELETKNARLGEVGVELVNLANDLADTKKLLAQDEKFLADLERGCKAKQSEWDERSRTRSQELVALSDTIKLLNDDQVMHLFKKTMPSTSLLQVQMSSGAVMHKARQALMSPTGGQRDPRLNLISMTMRGRKVNFDKVMAMVDKMIALLGKEQTDDDNKRSYCRQEFASSEDEKKTLEESISDSKKAIANAKDLVSTINEEIAKIAAGIKALNKAVADATKQRKAQNTAYVEELASNNAAIEILGIAKNRLNRFYNPKLHQPQPKRQLSEEDSITLSMGGTLAPTAAPGGLAGTGVVALQEAFSFLQTSESKGNAKPEPAPETWGEKSAKSDSSGVLSMLDTLIRTTAKQVAEMKAEEKDAQFEYEQFMKDSSEKHAADAKAISVKESVKAETEAGLQKRTKDMKNAKAESEANNEYLMGLHKQCDWLLENYKVRQDARTAEIASLRQAKAVLSGADYSFLQTESEVKHSLRGTRGRR